MTGRITSLPSADQRRRRLVRELQRKAWRIVDRLKWMCGNPQERDAEPPMRWRADAVSCVLHVGFVSIMETDEQIERLRREPLVADFSPARSRLLSALASHFVYPIDAVAAKVAGGQNGGQHSGH